MDQSFGAIPILRRAGLACCCTVCDSQANGSAFPKERPKISEAIEYWAIATFPSDAGKPICSLGCLTSNPAAWAEEVTTAAAPWSDGKRKIVGFVCLNHGSRKPESQLTKLQNISNISGVNILQVFCQTCQTNYKHQKN
jgi:hypothetical protein